jgi:hypothetical protein
MGFFQRRECLITSLYIEEKYPQSRSRAEISYLPIYFPLVLCFHGSCV